MTRTTWQPLTAVALALAVAAGGPADDKKDGDQPARRPARVAGKITQVNPTDRTVTVIRQRDSGPSEEFVKLSPDTKVFVDDKPAELKAVPVGGMAALVFAPGKKDDEPPQLVELRVTGPTVYGVVVAVAADSITLDLSATETKVPPKVFKVAPGARVVGVRDGGKLADLRPGQRVMVTLSADQSAVLSVSVGRGERERGGKEK